jgi:hypothetical protein
MSAIHDATFLKRIASFALPMDDKNTLRIAKIAHEMEAAYRTANGYSKCVSCRTWVRVRLILANRGLCRKCLNAQLRDTGR